MIHTSKFSLIHIQASTHARLMDHRAKALKNERSSGSITEKMLQKRILMTSNSTYIIQIQMRVDTHAYKASSSVIHIYKQAHLRDC
jgi:hypothetical protein